MSSRSIVLGMVGGLDKWLSSKNNNTVKSDQSLCELNNKKSLNIP